MSENEPKRRNRFENWFDVLLFIPELILIPIKYMVRGILWLVRIWLH
ncbi:hypothetical protein [Alkalibacillus almallahensis]|nr:hypothetical protein [Alkalibacillus almallahensis]NIK13007.1 hypothetical protein [Alkalibacillus almallahensis]